jgi:hypothetical protein
VSIATAQSTADTYHSSVISRMDPRHVSVDGQSGLSILRAELRWKKMNLVKGPVYLSFNEYCGRRLSKSAHLHGME